MTEVKLDRRLQELLDREELRALVAGYGGCIDRKDYERAREYWHDDAIADHGKMYLGPAKALVEKLPEMLASMEMTHHNITTINLLIDGDYAEGEIYVIAQHRVLMPDGPMDWLGGGRYLDKYERRNGTWKLLHRILINDWSNIFSPSIIDTNHPLVARMNQGATGPADPSYRYFKLFKFGTRPPPVQSRYRELP